MADGEQLSMNMADIENLAVLRGALMRGEPMARHTSWRAGGRAARAYVPADLDDMRVFVASLPACEPVHEIGLGSNLLVRDGGLQGTVIITHGVLKEIRIDGDTVCAGAGVPSPRVARFAAMHGLAGAEFLAGIPGTVGGALAMNAGCYGGETWTIIEAVSTIDRAGRMHERPRAQYDVGYRRAGLKQDAGEPGAVQGGQAAATLPTSRQPPHEEWFVAARFTLPRGDCAVSRATIRQLLERRIAAQPLNLPNAGSVFRNPPGDYAARLIEACGLKGYAIGGAMIARKHANFIVNTGNASAADIEGLIGAAREAVRQKFGIDLEPEVRIVGDAA